MKRALTFATKTTSNASSSLSSSPSSSSSYTIAQRRSFVVGSGSIPILPSRPQQKQQNRRLNVAIVPNANANTKTTTIKHGEVQQQLLFQSIPYNNVSKRPRRRRKLTEREEGSTTLLLPTTTTTTTTLLGSIPTSIPTIRYNSCHQNRYDPLDHRRQNHPRSYDHSHNNNCYSYYLHPNCANQSSRFVRYYSSSTTVSLSTSTDSFDSEEFGALSSSSSSSSILEVMDQEDDNNNHGDHDLHRNMENDDDVDYVEDDIDEIHTSNAALYNDENDHDNVSDEYQDGLPSSSLSSTTTITTNDDYHTANMTDPISVRPSRFIIHLPHRKDNTNDTTTTTTTSMMDVESSSTLHPSILQNDDDDNTNNKINDRSTNQYSRNNGTNGLLQQSQRQQHGQRHQQRLQYEATRTIQQQQQQQALPLSYHVPTRMVSLVEERVALQQLQQMEETTEHILSQSTFRTVQVNAETMQSIFLYWLSRPVRDIFYNKSLQQQQDRDTSGGEKNTSNIDDTDNNSANNGTAYIPMQRADALLRWSMHQFDRVATSDTEKHVVANVLFSLLTNKGESMNAGLCRLMSLFVQPLQGTNAALKDHGRRTNDNPKRHLSNLLSASRVYNIMQQIHKDNVYFPSINPDAQSYQSIMNLYGKRCRLLVLLGQPPQSDGVHFPRIRRGIRWSDPDTVQALGGCRSTRDCIDAAKQVLQEMKDNPSCSNPGMIHYSIILSMMSYAAAMNLGMADEAYRILRGLKNDPSVEQSIGLYNPVLLAYVVEAGEHKKRNRWEEQRIVQQKCENIFNEMRQHPNPAIASNSISYSIMLKLYQNIDRADKAQELLEAMESSAVFRDNLESTTMTFESSNKSNDSTITGKELPPDPTLMHYNTVLNAWAKSSNSQAGDRATALVRRMESRTLALTGMPHPIVPKPDHVSFTTTLDGLLRGGSNIAVTITQMEQILQQFEQCEDVERRPDHVTYNVIFHALVRKIRSESETSVKVQIADAAEQLLYRLLDQSTNFKKVSGTKMFRYYNECLRAWSLTNADEGPSRAIRVFRHMEDACRPNGPYPSARPNGTTYQHLLFVISQMPDTEFADTAKELFTKMEETDVPVTVTSLLTYLKRFLRYRFPGTADEADDAFVETLMDRFRSKKDRNDAFTPGMVFEGIFNNISYEADVFQKIKWSRRFEKLFRALMNEPELLRLNDLGQNLTFYYNSCIGAWAYARTAESTGHALRLLREMEDKHRMSPLPDSDVNCCRPNIKTYDCILTCLTRTPDLISVNSAREIFHKMEIAQIPITLSILNRFIRILSNSGSRAALKEAERILKVVEDDYLAGRAGSLCPNNLSYTFLVEGYSRSFEGLRDAERVIDHMKDISDKHGIAEVRPSTKLYLDLINHWSESAHIEAVERVDELFRKMSEISKPRNSDYAVLQSAWCRSKRPNAPNQVESILVAMQQEYDRGQNPSARPTIENFDFVIKAWATCMQPNSVERADAILKRLEELCYSDRGKYNTMRPSTNSYQYALLGWSISDNPDAGEHALAILDRMRKYHTTTKGAPPINQACFHHVITAIGKSSNTTNKAAKCYAILEEMRHAYESRLNRYSWPTHATFQNVFGVCATCTDTISARDEALEITIKVMNEYIQLFHDGARKDVYVQFLYAIFRLMPAGPERDNVVVSIFAHEQYKCPSSIYDSIHIREALQKTVSVKVFADIARICGRNPLLKSLNRAK